MKHAPAEAGALPVTLAAKTAADLMEPNPTWVRHETPVREVVAALIDQGQSAAAVLNRAGQPVGVVSRADLLVHDREQPASPGAEFEPTQVRDLMTPAVFSVTPQTPAGKVIAEMVAMKVNQLFVVEPGGKLVGVISAFDIVKHLRL
jgi:tRNA nucleotidyltransferase (CCA-adding enzyme)